MSVSDTLRWPADDRVDEFKTPELYAIGRTLGGGHAVQRLADQYVKVLKDRRRQLVGDALKADWTKWVTGCSAKWGRSEEHTSELQLLMRISYAVFCLKKKNNISSSYIGRMNNEYEE